MTIIRVVPPYRCVGRAFAAFVVLFACCGAALGQMATGYYVGDGVDNRNITGVGFQPDVVIVKADFVRVAVLRVSSMSGDLSKDMSGAVAPFSNRIQGFLADGFTIGNNNDVNQNGRTNYWVAFKARAGEMVVGPTPATAATIAPSREWVFSLTT